MPKKNIKNYTHSDTKKTKADSWEWKFAWKWAKQVVATMPNADSIAFKLRRKDYLTLKHSFLYINNKLYCMARSDIIGSGGYARVKLLEDQEGNYYAVKIASPKEMNLKTTMDILNLKNQFHKSIKTENKHYLITQYFKGTPLTPFKPQEFPKYDKLNLELLLETLKSVNLLHKHRFIHADIHEKNFIMSYDGKRVNVELIDFNLSSKLPENEDFVTKEIHGLILAPELEKIRYSDNVGVVDMEFNEGNFSLTTDCYSLGVCLDTILTSTLEHITKAVESPDTPIYALPLLKVKKNVLTNLKDKFIDKMKHPDPKERITNLDEVIIKTKEAILMCSLLNQIEEQKKNKQDPTPSINLISNIVRPIHLFWIEFIKKIEKNELLNTSSEQLLERVPAHSQVTDCSSIKEQGETIDTIAGLYSDNEQERSFIKEKLTDYLDYLNSYQKKEDDSLSP